MANEFIYFLTYTFMAIFPITNPIGMVPFFHALTHRYNTKAKHRMARRVAIYSFFVYWVALLLGSWILKFFSISIPIVKVAGGLIIYFSALGMLQSKPKISHEDEQEMLEDEGDGGDITFFPLTMPITTGAGSLAMAIAIGANIIGGDFEVLRCVSQLSGATVGIALLALTIFVCYYFADRLFAKLGKSGANVVSQISAFLLFAVSIGIIWDGTKALIAAM
jgi:multiple antibiotic resistance protein